MNEFLVDHELVRFSPTEPALWVEQGEEWQEVLLDPSMVRGFQLARTAGDYRLFARAALERWRCWFWQERERFPWQVTYDDGVVLHYQPTVQFQLHRDGRLERVVEDQLTICDLGDLGTTFQVAFDRQDIESLVKIIQVIAPRQPPSFRQQVHRAIWPPPYHYVMVSEREIDGRYISGCLNAIMPIATHGMSQVEVILPPTLTPQLRISGRLQPLELGEFRQLFAIAARRYDAMEMLRILALAVPAGLSAYFADHCDSCYLTGVISELDGRRLCTDCIVLCVENHPTFIGEVNRCRECHERICPTHCRSCRVCHNNFCSHHYRAEREECQACARRINYSIEQLREFSPFPEFEGALALREIRAQLPLTPPKGWTTIEVFDQPRRIVVQATSAIPTLEDYNHFPLQPFVTTLVWAVDAEGAIVETRDYDFCAGNLFIDGPHPHLNHGVPCWGNLGAPWHIARESQEIDVMLTVVFDFLSSYNPNSAYRRLENIPEYMEGWDHHFRGICDFCRRAIVEDDPSFILVRGSFCCEHCQGTCSSCFGTQPNDWLFFCNTCDDATCGDCVSHCSYCDIALCPEHMQSCVGCGRHNCLEHSVTCRCGYQPAEITISMATEELPY